MRRAAFLFRGLTERNALPVTLVLVVLTGLGDAITTAETTFTLFYLVPIVIATWFRGLRVALAIIGLCLVSSLGVSLFIGPHSSSWFFISWNACMQLGLFVAFAYVVTLLRERIGDEVARRTDALELARVRKVLAEVSSSFARAGQDAETILRATARSCAELIGDACAVNLVVEGTDELDVAAFFTGKPEFQDFAERAFLGKRVPRVGVSAQVMETRSPVIIPVIDPKEVRRIAGPVYEEFLERFPVYSSISVPLTVGDRVMGAVELSRQSAGRPYTEGDLGLLRDLVIRAGLAMDNVRLYGDLKASVEVRDDFLTIAGHELKTPLAALLLQIQALQRVVRKDPSARVGDRLEKAASTGLRLARLIDQLLDVSRITAGRLRLESEAFDLSELVEEVVARFAEANTTHGQITTRCEAQVSGRWDRLRVDQIITNLVGNAVKYGQGKPVEVELRTENGFAVLRVADHGIGIDEDQQKRIFQRFERAVSTRDFGGFGLGLWISRQFAEASGGTIEVDSTPGQGATFTLRLPMTRDEPVGAVRDARE